MAVSAAAGQKARAPKPRWYLIPVRVGAITFLLTLISFAVSLFLGILGVVIVAALRGVHPQMTSAYRHVALPVAIVVAPLVVVSATVVEIRHYRQSKALAAIENAG
jgi:hypothetical protein